MSLREIVPIQGLLFTARRPCQHLACRPEVRLPGVIRAARRCGALGLWFWLQSRISYPVSLVLRPFARLALTSVYATTASADFSGALTQEISPGKVRELSGHAVRFYLVRLW